jgi:hypothetical protein
MDILIKNSLHQKIITHSEQTYIFSLFVCPRVVAQFRTFRNGEFLFQIQRLSERRREDDPVPRGEPDRPSGVQLVHKRSPQDLAGNDPARRTRPSPLHHLAKRQEADEFRVDGRGPVACPMGRGNRHGWRQTHQAGPRLRRHDESHVPVRRGQSYRIRELESQRRGEVQSVADGDQIRRRQRYRLSSEKRVIIDFICAFDIVFVIVGMSTNVT